MKKNIHMPEEAGEWRKGGGGDEAGESRGKHQSTHFRSSLDLFFFHETLEQSTGLYHSSQPLPFLSTLWL